MRLRSPSLRTGDRSFSSVALWLCVTWKCWLVGAVKEDSHNRFDLNLRMPGARPTKPDQYLCFAKKFPGKQSYIVGFKPEASQHVTHHMIVMSCYRPQSLDTYWLCGGMGRMCVEGPSRTLYAWGKDAPGMNFPSGVGIEVGNDTLARYAVLQLHYTDVERVSPEGDHTGVVIHMTSQRPPYLAFIYLLLSYAARVPAGSDKLYNVDIQCPYKSKAVMHPFAFRTHAHKHAVQITAYLVQNGKYILIGTQSPQRPQAFYEVTNKSLEVHEGDILAARCIYNTSGESHSLGMGSTRHDEMCNFYTMYFVKAADADKLGQQYCGTPGGADIFDKFPSPTIPPFILPSAKPIIRQTSKKPTLVTAPVHLMSTSKVHHIVQNQMPTTQQPTGHHLPSKASTPSLVPDLKAVSWPVDSQDGQLQGVKLGQIGGLTVDEHRGRLLVFHRGPHTWDSKTFSGHLYTQRHLGPIKDATVLEVDEKSGKVLASWGGDRFYIPHGITTDKKGYVWLTDVAMHQVFKFRPGASAPMLTLGVQFQPGSGTHHFCQPAAVAVHRDGHVFVADGYCNSRIIKFTDRGRYVGQWGAGGYHSKHHKQVPFNIPHSLSLLDNDQMLCVADREHGRVLCYNSTTGRLLFDDAPSSFGGRLFAFISSKVPRGYYFAISGASKESQPLGFTLRRNGKGLLVERIWSPASGAFSQPHALCASSSGAVYVGEIGPNRLWKFVDGLLVHEQDLVMVPSKPLNHRVLATSPSLISTTEKPSRNHFSSSMSSSTTTANSSSTTSLLDRQAAFALLLLASTLFGALLGGLLVKHVYLRRQRRRVKRAHRSRNGGPRGNFTKLRMDGSESDEF